MLRCVGNLGGTGRSANRQKVTIYDVAAAAGVSHQTIANVIKSPERVAPATRRKVEEHISRLGFRPNRIAQNLNSQRSRLIGFRVQARSALATGGILDAFLQTLAESAEVIDHHVVLFSCGAGLDEVTKARELFNGNVADAFVIAETFPGDPRVEALVEEGLQFVSFGRTDSPQPHNWVDTDNVMGTKISTHHLIERGHQAIGFAGWTGASWVGDDRLAGWRSELVSERLAADDLLVARSTNDRNAAAVATEELLTRRPDITAMVAVSDEVALGIQQAARRLERTIAVVGYDDSPMALTGDGLTTIRQPIAEISRRIVQITARLIAGDVTEPTQERVAPELIVRGSSR
jgi:DNA-binding LacI/PurR family transcriptional regulator